MRANTVATIGIRGTSGIIEIRSRQPIASVQLSSGGGCNGSIVDTISREPPAQDVTTAVLGGGINDFGDPNGAVKISSDLVNGPPT